MQRPNYRITHARHDPAHCHFPGLFQSLARGKRRHRNFQCTHDFGPDERIEVKAFQALGADDMRVLQGLVAMAAVQNGSGCVTIDPLPSTEIGQKLRDLINLEDDAVGQQLVLVGCLWSELGREIGYNGTRNIQQLRACVERLSLVTFFAQRETTRFRFNLLSFYASNNRHLAVALNPRIAKAVVGRPYTHIAMSEVRLIKTDATRLIHQRVCAQINPGKGKNLRLESIVSYVWPETSAVARTRRHRNHVARKALEELATLPGWKVKEYVTDKFVVTRPEISDELGTPLA